MPFRPNAAIHAPTVVNPFVAQPLARRAISRLTNTRTRPPAVGAVLNPPAVVTQPVALLGLIRTRLTRKRYPPVTHCHYVSPVGAVPPLYAVAVLEIKIPFSPGDRNRTRRAFSRYAGPVIV